MKTYHEVPGSEHQCCEDNVSHEHPIVNLGIPLYNYMVLHSLQVYWFKCGNLITNIHKIQFRNAKNFGRLNTYTMYMELIAKK